MIGVLSVWPTTLIAPGSLSSVAAIRAMIGLKLSSTVALPDSNSDEVADADDDLRRVLVGGQLAGGDLGASAARMRCNCVMRSGGGGGGGGGGGANDAALRARSSSFGMQRRAALRPSLRRRLPAACAAVR